MSNFLAFFVVELILFLWYFATLPGSIIPPNNSNIPKPSLRTALLKFLTFQLPLLIVVAYLVMNGESLFNAFVETINKSLQTVSNATTK
jgi:predicted MFS family arabinose efflux permease